MVPNQARRTFKLEGETDKKNDGGVRPKRTENDTVKCYFSFEW